MNFEIIEQQIKQKQQDRFDALKADSLSKQHK